MNLKNIVCKMAAICRGRDELISHWAISSCNTNSLDVVPDEFINDNDNNDNNYDNKKAKNPKLIKN